MAKLKALKAAAEALAKKKPLKKELKRRSKSQKTATPARRKEVKERKKSARSTGKPKTRITGTATAKDKRTGATYKKYQTTTTGKVTPPKKKAPTKSPSKAGRLNTKDTSTLKNIRKTAAQKAAAKKSTPKTRMTISAKLEESAKELKESLKGSKDRVSNHSEIKKWYARRAKPYKDTKTGKTSYANAKRAREALVKAFGKTNVDKVLKDYKVRANPPAPKSDIKKATKASRKFAEDVKKFAETPEGKKFFSVKDPFPDDYDVTPYSGINYARPEDYRRQRAGEMISTDVVPINPNMYDPTRHSLSGNPTRRSVVDDFDTGDRRQDIRRENLNPLGNSRSSLERAVRQPMESARRAASKDKGMTKKESERLRKGNVEVEEEQMLRADQNRSQLKARARSILRKKQIEKALLEGKVTRGKTHPMDPDLSMSKVERQRTGFDPTRSTVNDRGEVIGGWEPDVNDMEPMDVRIGDMIDYGQKRGGRVRKGFKKSKIRRRK